MGNASCETSNESNADTLTGVRWLADVFSFLQQNTDIHYFSLSAASQVLNTTVRFFSSFSSLTRTSARLWACLLTDTSEGVGP